MNSVYLYAFLSHRSTSTLHASHLEEILKPRVRCANKGAVTIICDGGPNWSTKFTPNLIKYRQLWKNLKIDVFVMTCYETVHSRFNSNKQCWAPLSKELTRVPLSISVTEDNFPMGRKHCARRGKNKTKKGEVLNNAIDTCKKYWHDKRYDSCL